jgi:hypothetical protein
MKPRQSDREKKDVFLSSMNGFCIYIQRPLKFWPLAVDCGCRPLTANVCSGRKTRISRPVTVMMARMERQQTRKDEARSIYRFLKVLSKEGGRVGCCWWCVCGLFFGV